MLSMKFSKVHVSHVYKNDYISGLAGGEHQVNTSVTPVTRNQNYTFQETEEQFP